MAYDPSSDPGKVRLLLNDVDDAAPIFTDAEIAAFLELEPRVRRAAALAIDTNASNEALASKVIRSQDLSTDGAKVADALRKHAAALRARDQELQDEEADADGGGVHVTEFARYGTDCAELVSPCGPYGWPC